MLLFALTIIGLKILNDEPWINVLFCAIAAYTMQHFAYQFTNIIFTLIIQGESPLLGIYHTVMLDFTKLDANAIFWAAVYVMCYFSVYGVIWFLFGRKINKNESFKIKNQALVVIIGLVLILNVLLNAIFVYLKESLSFVILIIWHISGVFNCFLLLQWQFELVQNKQLQTELDFTKKLLLQAKE
ncbi:MAG: hypothetical protein J6B04_02990, partial [Clostridia bacterium]|nr:hypothetical protein [Clostridia bacterium]